MSRSDAEAGILKLVWMVLEPSFQHGDKDRNHQHAKGIHLGQPGHGDGGKAHAAGCALGEGVVRSGELEHTHQAAERTGQEHGAAR